jgi:DNA-binding transcriptional ArsR family regulator
LEKITYCDYVSKTGDTKKRIVEILQQKSETLTEISSRLNLAPSTVSQHLQELLNAGTIRLVDDRPRKWKYYELNTGSQTRGYSFSLKRVAYPVAIIVLAVILAGVFFVSRGTANTNAQQVYLAPGTTVPAGSTVLSVSDAPPLYNVSSLNITIDNASIHSETTGKWYKIPLQISNFNLIELKNISSILAGVKLKNGTYDNLVFYISNVTAVVNGTKQNVILPTGKLFVAGNFNISNSTTNWINIDFDLAHSLHLTSQGKLVMLPVITIRNLNDNAIQLNQSSIVVAQNAGVVRGFIELGMNESGDLIQNYSSPQNGSISNVSGKLHWSANGPVPIIIQTRGNLIIGGDARQFLNMSSVGGNASAQSNFTVYRYGDLRMPLPRECQFSAQPLDIRNSSANTSVQIGNATLVTVGGGRMPRIARCCYPINVSTQSGGNILIRRCIVAGPMAFNESSQLNVSKWNQVNVSAAWLHGNYTLPTNYWNAPNAMINVSVQNSQNGNYSAQCVLQNGALSCNSNRSIDPRVIAIGVGQMGAGRAVGPIGVGVNTQTNAHIGSSNANVTGTVSSAVNATSNVIGKIVS